MSQTRQGFWQSAAIRKLKYLTPLVVTQPLCIFRRTQSDSAEQSDGAMRTIPSSFGAKRRTAQAMAWFEFDMGPFVVSLNRP